MQMLYVKRLFVFICAYTSWFKSCNYAVSKLIKLLLILVKFGKRARLNFIKTFLISEFPILEFKTKVNSHNLLSLNITILQFKYKKKADGCIIFPLFFKLYAYLKALN